jgi:hypothetical protein
MRCSTCQYFEPRTFECRRYPPKAVPITQANRGARWPVVNSNDWCGKYHPRAQPHPSQL